MIAHSIAAPSFAADCGSEATYKAVPGGTASDIHFQNGSAAQRRIYWLDENGQRKLKTTVEAGQTQRVSTVAGHAWVVTDAAEKCLYVIVAASAPITAEVGGGEAPAPARAATPAAAAQPATLTATGLGLTGWYLLSPASKPGQALNNMQNGRPEIERVKPEWESASWQISDVAGGFVVITNKWTQKNLAVAGEGLHTIVGSATGQGAQWTLESAGGGNQLFIKSRFNGRYLAVAGNGFQFVDKAGMSSAAAWQLSRPAKSETVEAPVKKTEKAEKPEKSEKSDKSRKCPSGERFDADRLDCVSIKCGRHQVFSKSEGQCLDKSDTCGSNQVYSSSLAACIPKEQPNAPVKPKPQPPKPQTPKAPPCAYKRDGVGNCLTPAFLACQKAFGACMKACGNKAGKCEAACNNKYAGTCGD
jgi:hypothetical protein